MTQVVNMGGVKIGGGKPLALISGPCVIESRKKCLDTARRLVELAKSESIPVVFKASYDKANRSSHTAYRGPGLAEGLEILAEVRSTYHVPVLTDVHSAIDIAAVAAVVDVIQIPAFLCRQTDILI